MDMLERFSALISNLKSQQQEGEQPLATIERLFGSNPDIEKALREVDTSTPSVPLAASEDLKEAVRNAPIPESLKESPQAFSGYRFKNLPEMDKSMAPQYGARWQAHVAAIELSGVVPESPVEQTELERVHNLGPQGVGSILVKGKLCTFTQLMIEKV